jgi:predicted methyltransferase
MHTIATAALLVALAAADAAVLSAQARTPAPAAVGGARPAPQVSRDDWQRVPDIVAALGAQAGSRIADLGAGEGWLTTRLARQVGPEGRVFAVDISERALASLTTTLQAAKLTNVELVLGEDDDPRLPYGTLDGVVILNAYHEMTRRVPVLDGVKRALRPGGVLVIVDNVPVDTVRTRREQEARHTLALEFARDDLEAQGFEIVATDPAFITRPSEHMTHREWMLVARRPLR